MLSSFPKDQQRQQRAQARPTASPTESSADECNSHKIPSTMYTTTMASTSSRPRFGKRRLECLGAVPWKRGRHGRREDGSTDLLIHPRPAPRETPGFRLKEIDTAGKCPRWSTVCGPTVSCESDDGIERDEVPLRRLNPICEANRRPPDTADRLHEHFILRAAAVDRGRPTSVRRPRTARWRSAWRPVRAARACHDR